MLKRVFVGFLVVGILLLLGAGACYTTAIVTADTNWMDHAVNMVLGSLAVVGLGVIYALAIVAVQYLHLKSLSLKLRIELARVENKRKKMEMQSNIELEKADRAADSAARLNAAKMSLASIGSASSQAETPVGLDEAPSTTGVEAPEATINSPAASSPPARRTEASRPAASEDQDVFQQIMTFFAVASLLVFLLLPQVEVASLGLKGALLLRGVIGTLTGQEVEQAIPGLISSCVIVYLGALLLSVVTGFRRGTGAIVQCIAIWLMFAPHLLILGLVVLGVGLNAERLAMVILFAGPSYGFLLNFLLLGMMSLWAFSRMRSGW